MKRWSLAIILVVLPGTLAFAQPQPPSSDRPSNDRTFSSDLVQWSYMQEPQQEPSQPRQAPTPEPSPETQPAPNPSPSPSAHPVKPASPPAASEQAPAAQTFTGLVSKESDSFVLKVSETASYKLDNSSDVQQYEGKRVRVTGILDSSINLIHVDKIEPLS
jgi:Protein of unknown function (DUF5818)